jgi:Flp pilus assembly protein TadG
MAGISFRGRRGGSIAFSGRTKAFLQEFRRDERGVSAVFFGIMFTALFLAGAIAVEYGRITKEEAEQQTALDAAVLAASNELGLPDQDTLGQARAEKFFRANMPAGSTATVSVNLDSVAGEVTGTSRNSLDTIFYRNQVLGSHRRDHFDVEASTRVVKGDGKIEIALVVDNSGSMSADLESLKTAATNLVNVAFTGAEGTDKVKVGIVPFAASVNIGSVYKDAAWMDTEAAGPTHSENFSETKSRFDLFDELGTDWAGCVEARPSPNDVNDVTPETATPSTLFVPMFAPDEPDDVNADVEGYSYSNNYISDFGGTCPAPEQQCVRFNKKKGTCSEYGPVPIDVATAQSRICKYSGATPDFNGPNSGCTTPAIQPLTSTKLTITTAIGGLVASGNTNIGEGTMWGWRVLSPSAPFTEGRSYTEEKNKKVLVVMTDGANTYTYKDNPNKSRYGAFGYAIKGRLGTDYSSSDYSNAMDVKLTSACTNAKAAGIIIYTVAFRLEDDPDTQALLTACASDSDHYYAASSQDSLIQAFETIGKEISKLRIAG